VLYTDGISDVLNLASKPRVSASSIRFDFALASKARLLCTSRLPMITGSGQPRELMNRDLHRTREFRDGVAASVKRMTQTANRNDEPFRTARRVLVVMDQYTRRIIGFGIQRGVVDGLALCRMFKQAIRGAGLSKFLSFDHDPLYRFHQ
jgi:hypothetical protein